MGKSILLTGWPSLLPFFSRLQPVSRWQYNLPTFIIEASHKPVINPQRYINGFSPYPVVGGVTPDKRRPVVVKGIGEGLTG